MASTTARARDLAAVGRASATCRPSSGAGSSRSRMSRNVRAEHPGLLVGALGELGAADAAREAEVVADQRAGARLAADRLALDDQRREALRRRVDGGGQAGRARRRRRRRRSRDGPRAAWSRRRRRRARRWSGRRAPRRRAAPRPARACLARSASARIRRPSASRRRGTTCGTPLRVSRLRSSCAAASAARRPRRPPGARPTSARSHSWRNSVIVRWKYSSGERHGLST